MAFPPYFLEELRRRVSLANVVSRRVKLQRRGREFTGLCPFHKEKTPSFSVVEDKGFFHCLAAETRVITRAGNVPISMLAGKSATVLTRGGEWVSAEFRAFGRQRLYRIELSRNGVKKTLYATSGHRWFVRGRESEVVTTQLRPGHRLQAVLPNRRAEWRLDAEGVRHGIVFGDGSVQHQRYGHVHLHGEKDAELARWFPDFVPQRRVRENGRPYLRIYGGREFGHMKRLPEKEKSEEYLLGFIAGYVAADGHVARDGTAMLHSVKPSHLEWVRDVASPLGVGTFGVTTAMRRGFHAEERPIHRLHFVSSTLHTSMFLGREARSRFAASRKQFERLRWTVMSVAPTDRVEEVYCAEVPGEHAFALEDNILTGNCFGCGAHGDVISFAMQTGNLSFPEAVEQLAREAGLEVPKSTPEERERAQRQTTLRGALEAATAYFEEQLHGSAGREALAYLTKRGLDPDTILRFRLGYAPDRRDGLKRALAKDFPEPLLIEAGLLRKGEEGRESYDYFRGRVIFPIADRGGRVIAFGGRILGDGQPKYLNSPDTPLFEKGRVLYGWAQARAAAGGGRGPVIVVEGYMDVIALQRSGFVGAVAPLGTALTERQIEELWRIAPEPILCFDGDAAGMRAAGRALERALPLLKPGQTLQFATLPPGEDPDTLVLHQGVQAMREILAGAQPMAEFLWNLEVAAGPADTPERRAALERRLGERARVIADRTVQAHYQRVFRERLYEYLRGARPRGQEWPRTPTRYGQGPRRGEPPRWAERPPTPPLAQPKRQEQVLLAVLINHPVLLDEVGEELAQLEFLTPELDRLCREILHVHGLHRDLDAEALQLHLAQNGYAAAVESLLAPQVLTHAPFARREAEVEAARGGWHDTRTQFLRRRRPQQVAEIERGLAGEMTEEWWARLKALHEQREDEDKTTGSLID